jgi:hypothetical protein
LQEKETQEGDSNLNEEFLKRNFLTNFEIEPRGVIREGGSISRYLRVPERRTPSAKISAGSLSFFFFVKIPFLKTSNRKEPPFCEILNPLFHPGNLSLAEIPLKRSEENRGKVRNHLRKEALDE